MDDKTKTFEIIGKLPSLNDYTNSNRTHWGAGAGIKKKATLAAAEACKDIIIPDDKQVILHYVWYVSTRHDLDNIAFAQKFVQDGMVEAGVIKNDSPKYIIGFTHNFRKVDKGLDLVRVTVELV